MNEDRDYIVEESKWYQNPKLLLLLGALIIGVMLFVILTKDKDETIVQPPPQTEEETNIPGVKGTNTTEGITVDYDDQKLLITQGTKSSEALFYPQENQEVLGACGQGEDYVLASAVYSGKQASFEFDQDLRPEWCGISSPEDPSVGSYVFFNKGQVQKEGSGEQLEASLRNKNLTLTSNAPLQDLFSKASVTCFFTRGPLQVETGIVSEVKDSYQLPQLIENADTCAIEGTDGDAAGIVFEAPLN